MPGQVVGSAEREATTLAEHAPSGHGVLIAEGTIRRGVLNVAIVGVFWHDLCNLLTRSHLPFTNEEPTHGTS